MKNSRKVMILFVLLAMVMSLVPAVSAQDGAESVCLVTDVGRVNDGTFNQFAFEGAVAVTDDFELDFEFIETVSEADYETNLQTCIDDGADVIVTIGFLMTDATAVAAEANPDIFFIGVDQFLMGGPSNFTSAVFAEDQAGFVAGVLAALVASADGEEVIAGIYGLQVVPAVAKFRNGYEQGAQLIRPDWEVGTNILGTYADSFVDLAQGASLANQFIGEGAYVIFGAGGQTGSAGIAEAASQGVYVIGVDQDEYNTTFAGGETEGAEFIISSAMKRVDLAVYDLVALLAEGDYEAWDENGGGMILFDAEVDGVDFALAHDSDIPEEFYVVLDGVLTVLEAGCISTNVDPASGELMSDEDMGMFEAAEGCDEIMAEMAEIMMGMSEMMEDDD